MNENENVIDMKIRPQKQKFTELESGKCLVYIGHGIIAY